MEWNGARLKFPALSNSAQESLAGGLPQARSQSLFAIYSFGELCRLGFALTWPVAVVGLLVLGALVALLLRR